MDVKIKELTLNRNKVIDEAIFLAIVGRNMIKEGDKITSPVRLEMAIHKLQRCVDKLKEERE